MFYTLVGLGHQLSLVCLLQVIIISLHPFDKYLLSIQLCAGHSGEEDRLELWAQELVC